MRIDARSLFTGCALGTIILSIWSYQLQAATSGPSASMADKAIGLQPGSVGDAADEALKADTSWSLWPSPTDF
jgi:hypothetical protein